MGNPSSGCTVQAPMPLSRGRHRQSLSMASLQLEQLGQLGSITCDRKTSASAHSSPKKTSASAFSSPKKLQPALTSANCALSSSSPKTPEEKSSLAPFLGHKQVARRTRPSLSGTEDYLKGLDQLIAGGAEDRKIPTTISLFRGHRRVGSGNSITSSKSSESPRAKGASSSPGKDKYAVAKIAASLFHSSTTLERSMSLSRVAYKAIPAELERKLSYGPALAVGEVILPGNQGAAVLSRRQNSQLSSGDGSQTTDVDGYKKSNSHYLAEDMEEPLLSNAMGITKTLKGELGEAEPTTAVEDPLLFTEDASGLPSAHSQILVSAAESIPNTLTSVASPNDELHTEQPASCIVKLNPYGWTIKPPLPRDEGLLVWAEEGHEPCGVSETSILPCTALPPMGPFHLEPEKILLPLEADFLDPINALKEEERIAVEDIQPLLFATEKVTEEELTEAAVLSSLVSEDLPTGPVLISEESQQNSLTSKAERGIQASSLGVVNYGACLTKSVSLEPVAGDKSERKLKLRKRRRSVSASGIGAMLLKVVRVSDSGPIVTRRMPKVGPEIISGVDALRAREYVLQKTAQISMGPASAPASCRSEFENAAKSTSAKFVDIELDSGGDCVEFVQLSRDAHDGVDGRGGFVISTDTAGSQSGKVGSSEAELKSGTQFKHSNGGGDMKSLDSSFEGGIMDFGGASTCETRKSNPQATSERPSEIIPRHLPDMSNAKNTCAHEGVESCFHGRVERVNSNLQRPTADGQTKSAAVSATSANSLAGSAVNVSDRRGTGRPRRKPSSRGRNSYDFDSLPESLKSINSGLGQAAITRERSRSFVSRLQAPSGMPCVDVYRLAPSSISILANPSFSSSHQDRLWEEQAEAYSSGGRGTPGREDDPATPAAPAPAVAPANVFLHSPSPGGAISSDDQVPSASGSLRRGLNDSNVTTASTATREKGLRCNYMRRGQGKKRGRPRTPLRSLLADDIHSKRLGSGTRSPEGGHFIQQIMSRIRGNSSKTSSPKSPEVKRRITWSSCICFSIK